MDADFETLWDAVRRQMLPGLAVKNWSVAKNYTGSRFTIDDIDRSSVTVSGGRMLAPRRISKGDFAKVYTVWESYLAGNFPRSNMSPLSQNSTYILSILHIVRSGGR